MKQMEGIETYACFLLNSINNTNTTLESLPQKKAHTFRMVAENPDQSLRERTTITYILGQWQSQRFWLWRAAGVEV